jgi:hypothetical protein
MAITSKIRIARGLFANLPVPPNSFEIGRPYFCTDTRDLYIGAGVNAAMELVGTSSGEVTEADVTGLVDALLTLGAATAAETARAEAAEAALAAEIGGAGSTYEFTQSSPSAVWNIHHSLGTAPLSVTVMDSTNTQVLVQTTFTDTNNVVLTFSGAESGRATLIA